MVALPGTGGAFLVCEHEIPARSGCSTRAAAASARRYSPTVSAEIRRGPGRRTARHRAPPEVPREPPLLHPARAGWPTGSFTRSCSERIASPDLRTDSGRPSRAIIQFPCTTQDHVGGGIEFGPDGMLYIGMGDTGPQQDPQGHGQDLSLLLGKMLRIDVDRADAGKAYAIPADNPFVGVAGARPEIWAVGFREPWRFSFDPVTGDLWVGDVGQDRYEEVSIVRRGENHGWNVYEGFEPFSSRYRRPDATYVAARLRLHPPVRQLDHRRLRLPRPTRSPPSTASTSAATTPPAESGGSRRRTGR